MKLSCLLITAVIAKNTSRFARQDCLLSYFDHSQPRKSIENLPNTWNSNNLLKTNLKEPDFDSVDNLVDEETSIDIESDAIEDAPVIAPVPAVDSVPDPAVEEPAVEPTVDDPLAVDPAVDDPVEDDPVVDYPVVHPVIIIDDMDYEDTDDNMAEMVVEEMNLYEDGVNIHDKEDYEKPEHGKTRPRRNQTMECTINQWIILTMTGDTQKMNIIMQVLLQPLLCLFQLSFWPCSTNNFINFSIWHNHFNQIAWNKIPVNQTLDYFLIVEIQNETHGTPELPIKLEMKDEGFQRNPISK